MLATVGLPLCVQVGSSPERSWRAPFPQAPSHRTMSALCGGGSVSQGVFLGRPGRSSPRNMWGLAPSRRSVLPLLRGNSCCGRCHWGQHPLGSGLSFHTQAQ